MYVPLCVLPEAKTCPQGQEFEPCANQCPQRCSDLQQGIVCQGNTECQPGCRCPKGTENADLLLNYMTVFVCVCLRVCVYIHLGDSLFLHLRFCASYSAFSFHTVM